MIIVTNCAGQMCNRLFYTAHALALALESGRNLVSVFGGYVIDFTGNEQVDRNGLIATFLPYYRAKIVDGIQGLLAKLPCYKNYNATMPERIQKLLNRPKALPIFASLWGFSCLSELLARRSEIVAILHAKEEYHTRAKKVLSRIPEHDLVVGVHIRRGDYKCAFGGKYYYSDQQYADFMSRFEKAMGKKIAFVLVSNDAIDISAFEAMGCVAANLSGSPCEDVVLLSECDCIIGPISTFSGWAAYYGDKPIYRIEDIDAPIDMSRLRKLYQ